MELLWEAIWNKLINDNDLISMTGYTTTTKTIKRGNSTEKIKFSETVTRAVTFQEWTNVRSNRSSTSKIEDVTFLFVCWGKQNDKEVASLTDYLKVLLDGCDLTNASLRNLHSEYDDFTSPCYYDSNELCWRCDIRFRFKCALI